MLLHEQAPGLVRSRQMVGPSRRPIFRYYLGNLGDRECSVAKK